MSLLKTEKSDECQDPPRLGTVLLAEVTQPLIHETKHMNPFLIVSYQLPDEVYDSFITRKIGAFFQHWRGSEQKSSINIGFLSSY